jgi:hypothetical protein
MKKSYIKPEALEVKFETQGVIAASLPIIGDSEGGNSQGTNEYEDNVTNWFFED